MDKTTATDTQVHEEIAERLYAGDESVIEDILRLPGYAPSIQRVLCYRYKGYLIEEDIRDVIAIAIAKLWKYRESYDESKGSVRSLLFRIANNQAQDVQKEGWHKAKMMETVLEADEDGEDPLENLARYDRHAGQYDTNNDSELDEKLQIAIHESLGKIRPEYKYILEADAHARNDGVTLKELSERLGVPIGTVKGWRSRAKVAFSDEMKSHGYDLRKVLVEHDKS